MKKPKTKILSMTNGLLYKFRVDKQYHADLSLPDGHPNAMRVIVNAETNKPMIYKDGTVQVCAPWWLCGIFSLPVKNTIVH
jgi:hypothetical protein